MHGTHVFAQPPLPAVGRSEGLYVLICLPCEMGQGGTNSCLQSGSGDVRSGYIPDDRQMMVRIEVRFSFLKLTTLACVYDRLAKPFRVSCFPVSAEIIVRKICNQEVGTLNFDSKLIVD
jgi:hypothetical protein